MKNYGILIIVAFAVLIGGAFLLLPKHDTEKYIVNLEEITPYIGAYPFDKIKNVTLLELPTLQQALSGQAGKRVIAQIETLAVSTPLVREQGYLTFGACKQHDCPFENYAIWINEKSGALYTCYYKAKDEDYDKEVPMGTKFWFGVADKPVTLQASTDEGCNIDPKEVIRELNSLLKK